MNVYLVIRTDVVDYDEWDAIVVVAESEDAARTMGPDFDYDSPHPSRYAVGWTREPVIVRLVSTGATGPARTVLSSFNAG